MTNIKDFARTFLLCLVIVVAVALLASRAKADGPSQENIADQKAIVENQEILADNREAYEKFVAAKVDNESRVTRLNSDGWQFNWSTNELDPFPVRP